MIIHTCMRIMIHGHGICVCSLFSASADALIHAAGMRILPPKKESLSHYNSVHFSSICNKKVIGYDP